MLTQTLFLFAFALFAQAQVAPIATLTVNHQPLETFRGSFLTRLNKIGVYQATVCNNSPDGLRISEGKITQAVEKGGIDSASKKLVKIATISPILALPTIERARKRSTVYQIARILDWASWAGVAFTATGRISPVVRQVFPVVASASNRVSSTYEAAGVDLTLLMTLFLDPQKTVTLDGYGCASRIFLGEYTKSFNPLEIPIQ